MVNLPRPRKSHRHCPLTRDQEGDWLRRTLPESCPKGEIMPGHHARSSRQGVSSCMSSESLLPQLANHMTLWSAAMEALLLFHMRLERLGSRGTSWRSRCVTKVMGGCTSFWGEEEPHVAPDACEGTGEQSKAIAIRAREGNVDCSHPSFIPLSSLSYLSRPRSSVHTS